MCDYSIVIPVYFNERVVTATLAALKAHVFSQHPELQAEVIFVDDGSGDNSLAELLTLRQQNPQIVQIVKFTRNFGQLSAIIAGLSLAKGKCCVVISADLQDPPELINEMLKGFFEEGIEIVICTREGRDESLFRVWTSRIFYWMIRRLSFANMPEGGFDYLLLGRRAVSTILRNRDATAFFQGLVLWTGYPVKFIGYHRLERKIGHSRWTFGKKLTYLLDGLLGYSFLPIRIMSLIGICVAMLGFLYAVAIIVTKLVWGLPIEGWAPIMTTILAIGGMQMLMLGVIGEYLWRVLAQTRNREPYVIDHIYDSESKS